jgi:subtilisin-like proprotein convertase family protein
MIFGRIHFHHIWGELRMTTLRTTARVAALAVTAAAVAATGASTASAVTTNYSNTTAITIPDSGAGSLYPSPVTVAGANNGVTDVNVTLSGLQHTCETDVDFLLVGPQGQKALVMSDAGDCPQAPVSAVTITLDDSASNPLPNGTPLTSGTFQPGDNDYGIAEPDPFPAPAPDPDALGTGSALSVFNGTNPNGTWNLYVSDQYPVDSGQLAGGWSLQVSTVDKPAAPVITAPTTGTRDRDGAFTMTGTAPVSSTVKIYDGAALKTTVAATPTGAWTASIAGIPNGAHTFTATATDGFGNVSAASTGVAITVDSIKPQITATVPAKGAKHAGVKANIEAKASEALRSSTVTKANAFIVVAGTTKHLKAKVTWKSGTSTIVINPKADLAHGTKYKVTITTTVLDLAGNPLDQNKTKAGLQKKTWKFTTR